MASIIETENLRKVETAKYWINELFFNGLTIKEYVKSLINPLNVIVGIVVLTGLYFIFLRFTQGLAEITDSSNVQPWGLLLGVGLFTGVPFSASGFVMG